MTNQNIESLCLQSHNKDSIRPVISPIIDPEILNSLSFCQMPLFRETVVTVPIRADTVRFDIVPRTIVTIRSDTRLYDTVLGVFHAVQYGTPCKQDFVPITVPFSFVQR